MKKIAGPELARVMALRSVIVPGQGRFSQILLPGQKIYDPRRIRALLAALARHYAVDLTGLRRRCGELLAQRNYLPLPFSTELVLAPLPLSQEGEKTGYVNVLALQAVLPEADGCRLLLKGGPELYCWLSAKAVGERLLRARFLYRELSAAGVLAAPGAGELYRQKLELIRALVE